MRIKMVPFHLHRRELTPDERRGLMRMKGCTYTSDQVHEAFARDMAWFDAILEAHQRTGNPKARRAALTAVIGPNAPEGEYE